MLVELEPIKEDEIKQNMLDSIWKCIDGVIKQDQLLVLLNEEKEKCPSHFETVLADIINLIDVEIGSLSNSNYQLLSSNTNDQTNIALKREKFYSIIIQLKSTVGELLKERLEIETLESLKLIAKKDTFNQKYIKIKTRLFYKQQKFNLLREEAEGYSKLITELGQNELNCKILENIQSLIGCFNLDPNRVLDIILESFENNPSMHVAFINLLKSYKAEDETICQIIGFKFQSLHQQEKDLLQQYQQQQQQQQSETSNDSTNKFDAHFYNSHVKFAGSSLYTVTSYLLKYKMIDIDLLMPHLYPSDQQIQQFYKEEFESARQYAKKLTIVNLSDSSKPSDNTNSSSKSSNQSDQNSALEHQTQQQLKQQEEFRAQIHAQLNRLDNQRVSLVRSLVEIGDYKTCAKLIEKLPQWYVATYPDVTVDICKSLNVNIIDPIYKKCNSLSKYFTDRLSGRYSTTTTNTKSKSNVNSSQLIQDQSLSDMLGNFVDTVLPILSSLGPGVSYDTTLFTKLARICVEFLDSHKLSNKSNESNSEQKETSPPPQPQASATTPGSTETLSKAKDSDRLNTAQVLDTLNANELAFYNQIYTILNDVLMPSLSMIVMNPCLAIELWNLLKLFPYEMRYYLYNNWRQYTYKHFPQLIRVKAECQEKIKYLLKRLTKENVKIHGRQIGKLSHNNPIIVCDYILTQIQRYDNFINPIVDSLKFLTPLSYDILSYCTIVAISDPDKDKMKHDSISISSWLHSIATFCALTFKKYPIELTAIIQYVINQLKNRKSYDLLILQEIVQKMCGIEVLSEVNDLQLEAMAGGDILRQEAGYFNPIRNIKKCANRLKEALADHGLILPLCILLSQHRDYIVFLDQNEREQLANMSTQIEKRHLKLTGSLYDQCQDSLVQFSQFLSTTLTTEEYIEIFPKIDELVNEYHVSADVAFFLSRPMYAHHINSKFDELKRMDRMTKSAEKPTKTQRYLEAIDVVMQPVIDLVRTLHPAKIWEDMSPLFYTTFWTLSMNDIFIPSNAYEKQRASLKQKLNALDDNTELTKTKQKKEKEKIILMLEKLAEEENKQKDHVQHVKARFEREKEFWFPQKNKAKNETITVFLQLCIFSRCLFTQIDAFYCAKFIQLIHSLKTPNFSTIICYDRIFSDISYSIASLTDNEARKYGRFLLGLLETVMSWHSDSTVFEAECAQYPGFLTVFRNASTSSSSTSTQSASNKQEQLDYENFRHVCHKWHYKLTKSFIVCLESEEYLQMRNSLIILTKILPHYPRLSGFYSALEKRVENIIKNEKEKSEKDRKQDILTLAVVYSGQLKLRKPHMVEEARFHLKEQSNASSSSSSSSTTSKNVSESSSNLSLNASKAGLSSSSTSKSTPSSSDKFKQPAVPAKTSSSSGSGGSSSNSSSSQQSNSFVTKQLNAALQQATSSSNSSSSSSNSSSKSTNGQNGSSSSSSSSNLTSISSSTKTSSSQQQNQQQQQQQQQQNGSKSSQLPSSSSAASSSSSSNTNGKETSSISSSSSSSTRIIVTSSEKTSSGQNSPPHKSSTRDESSTKDKYYSSSSNIPSSNGTTTSSSKKRSEKSSQSSSPSSSSQPNSLTPTRSSKTNGMNEFSPTSSISSEEFVVSPKRSNSQSGTGSSSHQRHKSHSRSSSPKGQNNGSSHYSKSGSSSGHEKSKRIKTDDNTNGNSSKNYNNNGNSNGNNEYTSSSQSSSIKRKSSRDRGERGSDKEKKEHRKRDHSQEDNSDQIQHQKRSKSDETKKTKSSSVSSSSSLNTSQQQQSQQLTQQQQQNQSTNSSSSVSNKRSSKKHETSKDDFQMGNNGSLHLVTNSSSSKHRSSSSVDDSSSSRRSHDKSGSHYSKDKK